jgi:hypothetical protein
MRCVKGVAFLQVWLMVFGIFGFVFMMGGVEAQNDDGGNSSAGDSALLVAGGGVLSNSLGEETAKEAIKNKDSYLSNLLGATQGNGISALISGAQWAAIAYFAGKLIGPVFGLTEVNTKALSTALAAGFGVWKGLSTYSTGSGTGIFGAEGLLGANAGLVGMGIGAIIFIAMYKKIETKVVTFDCMPWQAPTGGNACEVCNDDTLPCSEYRCSSLGQSCEIVNEGSVEERCVYVNPRDVTPPIINPNYEMLSRGYQYKNVRASPPGPGFEIVNSASSDGCLKAFAPLEFGITTDEPSQCKIDFNYTENFDSMAAFVGGSNFYAYNHSEVFSLPGAEVLASAGFVLENGKDMQFYLRCKDKNGNENSASYAVDFCVDPSPDTTAPVVEATSILNGGCVAENTDSAEVVFYVNEPSECKWSFQDQHYDLMENDMSCSPSYDRINAEQLFGCAASLTGIPRDGTDYYVRCKDQPGKAEEDRNVNTESFEFSLRGSTGLVLKNVRPNETVFGGVSPAPIELYAETLFGCNEGLAICDWSNDGSNYIQFFDTNNEDGIHTQRLDLGAGDHNYYVRCVDAGGNIVEDVAEFRVDIDTNAPVVARVYEESGMLKIVTVRDSECSYSLDNCDFTFTQGVEMPYGNTTVHVAEWGEDNTYYIKCRDEFLNEGAGCSVIVRPTENFL